MASRKREIAEILRQRLLSGAHLGSIRPGQRLPSVRELAREFGVDLRVVLGAYRLLERDGVVELRQRSGIFAAEAHRLTKESTHRVAWTVDVLARGLSRGIPVRSVASHIERAVESVRLRVGALECNHDQIASLCRELEHDYGFAVDALDIDEVLASPDPSQALADVDLLVTTTFHSGEVQELALRSGKPWIAVSPRDDIFAEIAALLVIGPTYFVVGDARFAKKLRSIYASIAGAENFIALVEGRDDLAAIPPDAPTFVTRLVVERVRGKSALSPALAHARTDSRAFSSTSVREILTFIVTANVAKSH